MSSSVGDFSARIKEYENLNSQKYYFIPPQTVNRQKCEASFDVCDLTKVNHKTSDHLLSSKSDD